jgi:hypothetical protein
VTISASEGLFVVRMVAGRSEEEEVAMYQPWLSTGVLVTASQQSTATTSDEVDAND